MEYYPMARMIILVSIMTVYRNFVTVLVYYYICVLTFLVDIAVSFSSDNIEVKKLRTRSTTSRRSLI